MKKFIVETFYTCTFKTTHTLDELNDKELSKIDDRKDREVEIIDVKLNNRKTKKFGEKTSNDSNKTEKIDSFVEKFISSDDENLFAVIEKKQYYWIECFC